MLLITVQTRGSGKEKSNKGYPPPNTPRVKQGVPPYPPSPPTHPVCNRFFAPPAPIKNRFCPWSCM